MYLTPHIALTLLLIYMGICVLYFLFQEKFIFVPTWPADNFRSRLHTPTEEFHLHTPHGGRIHALLLKVEKPAGLIFYLHGNTGSLRRWQFMAEELATYGYDVIAMDYRGYGLSHGPRRESWMHRDVEAVYDMIVPRYAGRPVIVYGRSLGSGFATRLASRRRPDKLILETPFSNLIEVARYYVPFIPVKWLLRYFMRSDLFIQHVHCPVLILHGTKDRIVPYRSALALFRLAESRGQVQMTTIVGGRHGNLNSFPLFREKLREFLFS